MAHELKITNYLKFELLEKVYYILGRHLSFNSLVCIHLVFGIYDLTNNEKFS